MIRLVEYKKHKQLLEIITDDKGTVHLALEYEEGNYKSLNRLRQCTMICDSCKEVTLGKLVYANRMVNTEDDTEYYYELVSECTECGEVHHIEDLIPTME